MPLTIYKGVLHEYLGMTVDFFIKHKVKINMSEYINKIFTDLPDDCNGTAVTPAANHLFTVDSNCPKLTQQSSEHFHHVIFQLIFLAKRGRPDLLTGVAFLTTRVKNPDNDDLKKFKTHY